MNSRLLLVLLWTTFLARSPVVMALVPPLPVVTTTTTLAAATASSPLWTTTAACSSLTLLADEMELAELPPPYVPALFGVALLVGVGIFTGSLGNVMDEEASLGLQSGARAKKEIERSRSSYFKQPK